MSSDPDESSRTFPQSLVETVPTGAKRPSGPSQACLVEIYGDKMGRRVTLGDASILLGRSASAEVQIEQQNVSREHTRIDPVDGQFQIVDLKSTNGTYVNDMLVDSALLRDGDQIKIGRTILKFITSGNIEAQYHEEIYRLMTMDGLTELYNKRFFNEELEKEVARFKRYDRVFSVILYDLDHFKQINDTHGHLAGDAVLRQLSGVVKAKVRRNDTLARLGGEEFGILLPEVALQGGVALAHKLCRVIEKTRFGFDNIPIQVTISLGVAQWDKPLNDPGDIIKLADEKLYEAKRSGRNRVSY